MMRAALPLSRPYTVDSPIAVGEGNSLRRRLRASFTASAIAVVVGGALWCGNASNALAATEDVHDRFTVEVGGGRLSVDLGDVPIKDVLKRIGEEAGIRVIIRGDPGSVRPQAFSNLPLETAVERLVGDNGLVMIRANPESPNPQLIQILVYGRSGGVSQTVLAEPDERTAFNLAKTDRRTRLRSVRKLARERNVGALAKYLAQDEDATVRRIAATALGNIRGDAAATALSSALEDQDAAVRIRATRGLRLIKGVDAARQLSEVVINDSDPEVRRLTVNLLGQLEGPDARAALRAALNDTNDAVRRAANQALARWKRRGL